MSNGIYHFGTRQTAPLVGRRELRLIPSFLFDDVLQGLAAVVALELRQKEAHRLLGPVGSVIGAMRREKHVREFVEWVAFREGLLVEHVERRAANALLAECADKSGLVDYRA